MQKSTTLFEKIFSIAASELSPIIHRLRERDDNDRLTVEEGEKIVEHFHSECLQVCIRVQKSRSLMRMCVHLKITSLLGSVQAAE